MVTIIEQSRVPQFVSSLSTLMEIEMITTIEHVQPIFCILASVGVNDIEQDYNSHSVSSVDQVHQLLRSAISAGNSKEGGDLVSERSIVCVFLDGHQLNDVVSKLLDPRKNLCSELLVGSDPVLSGTNTDMGLIDTSRLGLCRAGVLEDIFLLGIPENSVVDTAYGKILGNTLDPGRKTIKNLATRNFQSNLVEIRIIPPPP